MNMPLILHPLMNKNNVEYINVFQDFKIRL